MNVAESNAMEVILKGLNVEKTEDENDADYVIINTCSVRASAESRVFGRLGYFSTVKKKNGKTKIILTGCMASRIKDELKEKAPYIDYIIGNTGKEEIPFIINGEEREVEKEKYSFLPSYFKEGEFSSYVPIMNGCNNFCSYCIVPYVRGREVSRPLDDVVREIKRLGKSKVKEITLLGQNVNSYKDGNVGFPELLEALDGKLGEIEFVRFESPHPKDFSSGLISVIGKEKKIARHIHLPMQSGSTRVLKLMNRKYSKEDFLELVERIKEGIEGVTFSTDVMVGFPTETESEFLETIEVMDKMPTVEAFMYYFNPREGTKAYSMDGQIPIEEKTRRLEYLIEKQLERAKRMKSALLPFKTKAIVLGKSRDDGNMLLSRDEHNYMTSFIPLKEHKEGDVVELYVDELKGNTFRGREV